jgi:hypothetical protein
MRLATIERQTLSLKSDLWRSVMDATGQEYYFNAEERGKKTSGSFAP